MASGLDGGAAAQVPLSALAVVGGSDDEWLRRYAAESLGGWLGGSVSIVAGHPFDTVKVRLQAGAANQYAGAIDCARQTVGADGTRALFRGMLSPLLTNSAMGAVTFSTWQEVQRLLHPDPAAPAPLPTVFAAGAAAGVVQCSIATPMELVRTKLQVQSHGAGQQAQYRGNLDCMRQVCKSEGIRGLYRGNASMMLREGPAFGVYFSVYEAAKRRLCPDLRPDEHEPVWVEASAGAVTGAVTWAAVMPVDAVSTRIQALSETAARDPAQRSMRNIAAQIYAEGGVRAFYRGLPAAVMRGVVLNSIVFPVYEATVRWMA